MQSCTPIALNKKKLLIHQKKKSLLTHIIYLKLRELGLCTILLDGC